MMNELLVEIFAVGKWNGYNFSKADLQEIAANFKSLKENHRVPLKFGHNDEQQMTDGFPALGWVEDVFVNGSILMAKFVDIPDLVFSAIEKKLYRNVSIELDIGVKHKERFYNYVLSGVALLGADIPAVNVLKDLTHYMSRDEVHGEKQISFSAIDTNFKPKSRKEGTMEISEKEYQDLKFSAAKADQLEKDLATSTSQVESLSAEMKQFKADQEAKERADFAAKVADARKNITELFDNAVKDMRITPAQKENFSKLLRIDDDNAVVAIAIEDVKGLIGEEKSNFSKDKARQSSSDRETEESVDDEVTRLTYKAMEENSKLGFAAAMDTVLKANPKLAEEYISNSGGEK